MGVKAYYYVVAAVLGFGFLIPQHGNKKKIYQKYFMNQLIYHRVTAEELDKSILGNRFFLLLLHKRNPVIQGEFAETRWKKGRRLCGTFWKRA